MTYTNRKPDFECILFALTEKRDTLSFSDTQINTLIEEINRWKNESNHVVPVFGYDRDGSVFMIQPNTKYAIPNLEGTVNRLKDVFNISNLENLYKIISDYKETSEKGAKIIRREWALKQKPEAAVA
jgi:hypothetical protein